MTLVEITIPTPLALRGGWAAFAAVCSSRGWADSAYADGNHWYYHDGGGNWASLRFFAQDRAVLIGHDHEYSETYFREAATYFGEEETDLLAFAPDWWGQDLDPKPFGEWIGFIYGWDGTRWQRSPYEKPDGFSSVGLIDGCSINDTSDLTEFAAEAPGLNGQLPDQAAIAALIAADASITDDLLAAVVPGWDIAAGVAAGRKFLEAPC